MSNRKFVVYTEENMFDMCENYITMGNECEHCGKLHPKQPLWCDGDTWWCIPCSFDLTNEDAVEILRLLLWGNEE